MKRLAQMTIVMGMLVYPSISNAEDDLYLAVGSYSGVALLNANTMQTTTVINEHSEHRIWVKDSVKEAVIGYDRQEVLTIWTVSKMAATCLHCHPLEVYSHQLNSLDQEGYKSANRMSSWRAVNNYKTAYFQGVVYDKRLKAPAGVVYDGSIRDKFKAKPPFLARISDEKYVESNIDDCVFVRTQQNLRFANANYTHEEMIQKLASFPVQKSDMWNLKSEISKRTWYVHGQSRGLSLYRYPPSDHSNPSISKEAIYIYNRDKRLGHYQGYVGGRIHTYTFDEAVAIWHWDLIPRSQVPDGPLVKQQTHPAGKEPHIVMPTDRYEFYLADSDSFTTATVDPMMRIVYANSSFAWFSKLTVYEPSRAERRSAGLYQLDFKDGKASKLRLVESLPFGAAWIFKVPEKPDEQADQPSPDAP